MLGFLVAVLVAVGFEIALRKAKAALGATGPDDVVVADEASGRPRAWAIGVGVVGRALRRPDAVRGLAPGLRSGQSLERGRVRAALRGGGLAIIGVACLAVWVLWRFGCPARAWPSSRADRRRRRPSCRCWSWRRR